MDQVLTFLMDLVAEAPPERDDLFEDPLTIWGSKDAWAGAKRGPELLLADKVLALLLEETSPTVIRQALLLLQRHKSPSQLGLYRALFWHGLHPLLRSYWRNVHSHDSALGQNELRKQGSEGNL